MARRQDWSVGFLISEGDVKTVNSVVLTVLGMDAGGLITSAQGTTVPTDASSGFSKGCLFVKTNASGGTSGFYVNNGTTTSSLFTIVGSSDGSASAVVALTATQTKALFTTEIELVAAPGANKMIAIDEIILKNVFGTAAYQGSNALEFRYTSKTGAKVAADMASTVINLASGTEFTSVKGVTTSLTPVANAKVVVNVPTANPTVGDGILTFTTKYRIVTP